MNPALNPAVNLAAKNPLNPRGESSCESYESREA